MRNKTQNSKVKSQKFLEKIIEKNRVDLSQKILRIHSEISENQNFRKSESKFLKALSAGNNKLKLIAELKFASPTNSSLGSPTNLTNRAKQYESAGADAISIITEKHYFKGDVAFVSKVKKEVSLPILQKDFITDPVQIYEAKDAGADALLLITRLVSGVTLKKFVTLCLSIGLEPVIEINNEEDLVKAVKTKTRIIAVNARDLETFKVDVVDACMLIEKIPRKFIKLGFSGVVSQKEVLLYKESGVDGILVGTSLMKSKDIKNFISKLQL